MLAPNKKAPCMSAKCLVIYFYNHMRRVSAGNSFYTEQEGIQQQLSAARQILVLYDAVAGRKICFYFILCQFFQG